MQVYLDNSATTKPCEQAVNAMLQSMRKNYYNPSALYTPAMQAENEIRNAQRVIAKSLCANEKNVIFTSGGTESDNLAILGYMQHQRTTGELLYTAAEHPAVKNACLEAEIRFGCVAREIPLEKSGTVDLSSLESMLGAQTQMLCVMQVCNETGVTMPLAEICALRDRLAPQAAIHVDGVQGYLREPFSLKEYGVQSYALSGHKIHGPKGVGALVLSDDMRVHPQMLGGGQQGNLRSGTENTSGISGLCAAVEAYPQNASVVMRALKQQLVNQLKAALPQMVLLGLPADHAMSAGHVLSVAFPPVRAETLLHALEAEGIYVGTGSACSSKKGKHSAVLTAMKQLPAIMEGAIRISLCPTLTTDEMLYTGEKIIEKVTLLQKFARR
ncbi:MAG: cysteine desulfurase family protein [Clostridia bacterium]